MLKLNAFEMKLVILLLLSITVSTLARPQNDNSNMNNIAPATSDQSGPTGNSGNSNGGGLDISNLLDVILNKLKPILGEEIVGLLKTFLDPLYHLPMDVVKDLQGITDLVQNNPLTNTLGSLPLGDAIVPSITTMLSTPFKIFQYVISLVYMIIGNVYSFI